MLIKDCMVIQCILDVCVNVYLFGTEENNLPVALQSDLTSFL